MAKPTPEELAQFLGNETLPDFEAEDRAAAIISIVSQLAKSYTRGGGFADDGSPAPDINAVIVCAAARLITHPSQLGVREEMGALVVDWRGGFSGWSLAERAVLDRYRVKAL